MRGLALRPRTIRLRLMHSGLQTASGYSVRSRNDLDAMNVDRSSVFRAAGALCNCALYSAARTPRCFANLSNNSRLFGSVASLLCAILSDDEKLFHLGLHVLHTASPCARSRKCALDGLGPISEPNYCSHRKLIALLRCKRAAAARVCIIVPTYIGSGKCAKSPRKPDSGRPDTI